MTGRERRWGLQSAMTATYVAVTAGVVLLTELVIFGVAAVTPQAPPTPVQVQGFAEATAAQLAAKLAVTVTADGSLPTTNIGLPGAPVSPGQARPDGNGGVTIPQTSSTRSLTDSLPVGTGVSPEFARTFTNRFACVELTNAGYTSMTPGPEAS